eukprot:753017-Hanusia_phi.AAC.1
MCVCSPKESSALRFVQVTETGERGIKQLSSYGSVVRRIGYELHSESPCVQSGKGIDTMTNRDNVEQLLVADSATNQILVINIHDGKIERRIGKYGSKPGCLHFPFALHVTSERRILVSERLNKRVQEFDEFGQFVRVCIPGQNATNPNGIDDLKLWGEPRGISTGMEKFVYIVDASRQNPARGRVVVLSAEGAYCGCIGPIFGGRSSKFGQVRCEESLQMAFMRRNQFRSLLLNPFDVAATRHGTLLVTHEFSPSIRIDEDGGAEHLPSKVEPLFAVLSEFDQATRQWMRFIAVASASPGVGFYGIAVGNAGKTAVLDHNSISVMSALSFPVEP